MRNCPMMEFPLDEYEVRMANLVAKIQQAECDAVLLTNEENLRYFCDYRSAAWSSEYEYPAMMVVTKAGDAALLTSVRRRPTAEETCCLEPEQIFVYEGFGHQASPEAFVPAVVDALKRLGTVSGKLGTETGVASRMRITYRDYENLFAALPGMQAMDFAGYIFDLREIKSPREIEVMRKCCGIAVEGFRVAMDQLKLGETTEEEMYHTYTAACFDMGADDMEYILIVEFGPDRPQPNCMAGARVYENADWCVFLDSGPSLKGYVTDIIRIGKLSKPTKAQEDFYKISLDCHRACIAMVKPGVKIGDLCKAHDDFMRAHGVEEICLTMNNSGHGVGLDVHEMPIIKSAFADKEFRPGMVFAFEPTIIHSTEGQIVLENNYLVTETGCENLTAALQDIYVPQRSEPITSCK